MRLTINVVEKKIQILFSGELPDKLSNGLSGEDQILAFQEQEPEYGATEILIPMIRDLCLAHGFEPKQFTRIACVTGPGNFMGIRTALTTSAALARTCNAEQAPLNYMQCLASSLCVPENSRISVLTNATRTHVHRADFIMKKKFAVPASDTFLMPLMPPRPIDSADMSPETQYILGSALLKYQDQIKPIFLNAEILPTLHPTAQALFMATQYATWQKEDLSPLYLKECDALQNFEHISKKRGHDPKEARAFLDNLLNT